MLKFAYNTNGFLSHKLDDAIAILADLGYQGISITLDTHHLPPFSTSSVELQRVSRELRRRNLEVAIETGGRYILDPRKKHSPNLLSSEGSSLRVRFLERAIEIAAEIGSSVVSFWSGTPEDGCPKEQAYTRLVDALEQLLSKAEIQGVKLAFEPEPGMLVAGQDDFAHLESLLEDDRLALTLDVGHLFLTEKEAPQDILRRERNRLVNVHIEDMKPEVHEHLPFGDGEIDFPPILRALEEIGYSGLVSVELSRSSHQAPIAAQESIEFLRRQLTASRQ